MASSHWITQLHWRAFALLALLLGLIGIPVPGLPTVPFVLLAAWCAGKGWPALESWLLEHPHFGPSIRQWRNERIVSRRAKVLASVTIAISLYFLWTSQASFLLALLVTITVVTVNIWLWCQREQ